MDPWTVCKQEELKCASVKLRSTIARVFEDIHTIFGDIVWERTSCWRSKDLGHDVRNDQESDSEKHVRCHSLFGTTSSEGRI